MSRDTQSNGSFIYAPQFELKGMTTGRLQWFITRILVTFVMRTYSGTRGTVARKHGFVTLKACENVQD